MATVSVKLVLRKDKQRKDGSCPIWIRMTAERKRRYIATGVYVSLKHWDEKREVVRRGDDLAAAKNATLRRLYLGVSETALDSGSAEEAKAISTGTSGTVDAAIRTHIAQLDEEGGFWEGRKFRTTLEKMIGCFGSTIAWDRVGPKALRQFEHYLRSEHGNATNTIRKEMGRVRRIVKQAIRDGDVSPDADPFVRYRLPKAAKVHRRRLRFEEVMAIAKAEPDKASEQLARDAFVFSFFASGIRFGDLARLKETNIQDGVLRYTMAKTGQPMEVRLPLPALDIASAQPDGPFLFSFLRQGDDSDPDRMRRRVSSANASVNSAIKRVVGRAGVSDPESVTFHVSRHSYANMARGKTDLYLVSRSLGHQSLAITEAYLGSLGQDDRDRTHSEIWGQD